MNMNDYMVQSGRTAAGTIHTDKVSAGYILHRLTDFTLTAAGLDQVKKALFYGRENLMHTHGRYDEHVLDVLAVDKDITHAILGVATESAELVEHLERPMMDRLGLDRAKVIDEAGDILWYLALLFRSLGVTFEEVADLNIAKLSARFPEKFTNEQANVRDLEKEARVFQAL